MKIDNKKRIVLLLGPPGSGKSTQGAFISKDFSIPHLSSGNLIRHIISQNCEDALRLKKYLSDGAFIPDDLMIGLIDLECSKDYCVNGFILDGYPRNVKQCEHFFGKFTCDMLFVLNLEVDFSYIKSRILGRYYCAKCKFIYNKYHRRPVRDGVCDFCESEDFSFRDDDSEHVLQRRFEDYCAVRADVIRFCNDIANCYFLSAEKSSEDLYKEIYQLLAV